MDGCGCEAGRGFEAGPEGAGPLRKPDRLETGPAQASLAKTETARPSHPPPVITDFLQSNLSRGKKINLV